MVTKRPENLVFVLKVSNEVFFFLSNEFIGLVMKSFNIVDKFRAHGKSRKCLSFERQTSIPLYLYSMEKPISSPCLKIQ